MRMQCRLVGWLPHRRLSALRWDTAHSHRRLAALRQDTRRRQLARDRRLTAWRRQHQLIASLLDMGALPTLQTRELQRTELRVRRQELMLAHSDMGQPPTSLGPVPLEEVLPEETPTRARLDLAQMPAAPALWRLVHRQWQQRLEQSQLEPRHLPLELDLDPRPLQLAPRLSCLRPSAELQSETTRK